MFMEVENYKSSLLYDWFRAKPASAHEYIQIVWTFSAYAPAYDTGYKNH